MVLNSLIIKNYRLKYIIKYNYSVKYIFIEIL